eukprot:PhF_6_TR5675/c0_g1_i1/m.8356
MLSLVKTSDEPTTYKRGGAYQLPQDCINHVLSFCEPTAASAVYLVCRSWYHSVDRHLCLADDFYYLPDTSKTIKYRWYRTSAKMDTLKKTDNRWAYIQTMYITVDSTNDIKFPPALMTLTLRCEKKMGHSINVCFHIGVVLPRIEETTCCHDVCVCRCQPRWVALTAVVGRDGPTWDKSQ